MHNHENLFNQVNHGSDICKHHEGKVYVAISLLGIVQIGKPDVANYIFAFYSEFEVWLVVEEVEGVYSRKVKIAPSPRLECRKILQRRTSQ
jgi:hypothetical protein